MKISAFIGGAIDLLTEKASTGRVIFVSFCLLVIMGTFALYEGYTGHFRLARLQNATALLHELADIQNQLAGKNDPSLTKTHAQIPEYSPVIAHRLRAKGVRSVCLWTTWFVLIGGTSIYKMAEILRGEGNDVLVGALLTILLFSLLPAYGSLKSILIEEPNLMPYFSSRVPGSGLCSGFALLRHSKKIDEFAAANQLKPIVSMISADDLFDKKPVSWGSPNDALTLVERLLSLDENYIAECRNDMEELKPRLEYAIQENIKFCFLIRTAHGTNGMEWEQREGHC